MPGARRCTASLSEPLTKPRAMGAHYTSTRALQPTVPARDGYTAAARASAREAVGQAGLPRDSATIPSTYEGHRRNPGGSPGRRGHLRSGLPGGDVDRRAGRCSGRGRTAARMAACRAEQHRGVDALPDGARGRGRGAAGGESSVRLESLPAGSRSIRRCTGSWPGAGRFRASSRRRRGGSAASTIPPRSTSNSATIRRGPRGGSACATERTGSGTASTPTPGCCTTCGTIAGLEGRPTMSLTRSKND